jgi:hypothetical protein
MPDWKRLSVIVAQLVVITTLKRSRSEAPSLGPTVADDASMLHLTGMLLIKTSVGVLFTFVVRHQYRFSEIYWMGSSSVKTK